MISRPSSILLVDRTDEREMYAEYLCGEGYWTLEARNAPDAFRLATEQLPTVVVTEMLLEDGHTGIEFVASLRADRRTRNVPVIVLTGRVFEDDRATAVDAGCDLFLGKPCLPDELAREIQRMLAKDASVGSGGARDRRDVANVSLVADEWRRRSRTVDGLDPLL
jgi:CheY-like chemotaxis protein